MKITANLHGYLTGVIGTRKVQIDLAEGSTLRDLMNEIGMRYGDDVKQSLGPWAEGEFIMLILINGQDQHFLGGLDSRLNEGDDIDFMPPMSGGSIVLQYS